MGLLERILLLSVSRETFKKAGMMPACFYKYRQSIAFRVYKNVITCFDL